MGENGSPEREDWVRGPKTVDPAHVSLEKALDAHRRGINIVGDADAGKAVVTKTVVKDMPAARLWWKRLFRRNQHE